MRMGERLRTRGPAIRSAWWSYAFAATLVVLAAVLRWALPGVLAGTPYLAFYPAVVAAAALGGVGPGLLATVGSILCVDLLFDTTPGRIDLTDPLALSRLTIFLAGGVGTSVLAGLHRRARVREQKQAESARQSERQFRELADSMPQIIWAARPDGYLDYYNRKWSELTGAKEGEGGDSSWLPILHPEDRQRCLDIWYESVRTGKPYQIEYRFKFPSSGEYRWHLGRALPVRDETGQIIRWYGTGTDIHDSKQAEQALREQEQRLRASFDNAALGIVEVATDDRIIAVNERLCEMLGYRRQELLGRRVHELTAPDDRPRSDELNAQVHQGLRDRVDYEKRYLKHDGSPLWVHVTVSAIRDQTGRWLRSIGTAEDISERKAAETQLRLHAAALEAAANGIAITDSRGTIVWANRAFEELTGYRREELVGQNPRVLKSGEQDDSFYHMLWQTIRQGQVWHGELVNRRKDGTLYTEEMTITPLRDGQGAIIHFIAIKQDVSTRKAQREALAAAKVSAEQAKAAAEEANRAKDHFLAVLSHELRTPLTPVVTAVSMLQGSPHLEPGEKETLEMVRRNVEMEARLIDDLLDVTRIERGKVELVRRPVELCTVIERAIDVCRPDIEARGLHFEVDWGQRPHWVEADVARLQQVFWNLLKNAIKFTPHDGCVGLRCRRDQRTVIVEVIDSGIGIEPEAIPRVFNAFEQAERSITRQFGGLGLGLAISKSLVEMHGGIVEAHSDGKDKGATFRVKLPLCISTGEPAADQPAVPTRSEYAVRPLRILLVEDHGDTARMMQRLLKLDGHSVERAGDVATALELASQYSFDLLLSDLGLPDRSGLDLMRELRMRGCTMPGIALSGYGQEEDIRRSKEAGFATHLTKPTSPDRLAEAIAAITGCAATPPSR